MRTTPRIGTKVWFGPRRYSGWGWEPVSWEGWVALAVSGGLVVAASVTVQGAGGLLVASVPVAALIVVCMLKGTSPGGFKARREYDQTGGRRRLVRGWRPPEDPSLSDIAAKSWPSDEKSQR